MITILFRFTSRYLPAALAAVVFCLSCSYDKENVIPELILDVPDQIKPEISSILLRVMAEDLFPIEIDLARQDEELIIPTGKNRTIFATILNGEGVIRATGGTVTDISARENRIVLDLKLPPRAPVLQPVQAAADGLVLKWDRYPETDSGQVFRSYRVYRNTFPTVSEISEMVTEITDIGTTEYTDTGLLNGQEYYYRVYVFTNAGAFNVSTVKKAVYRKTEGRLSWNGTRQP